jgi:hypothetical protein
MAQMQLAKQLCLKAKRILWIRSLSDKVSWTKNTRRSKTSLVLTNTRMEYSCRPGIRQNSQVFNQARPICQKENSVIQKSYSKNQRLNCQLSSKKGRLCQQKLEARFSQGNRAKLNCPKGFRIVLAL